MFNRITEVILEYFLLGIVNIPLHYYRINCMIHIKNFVVFYVILVYRFTRSEVITV